MPSIKFEIRSVSPLLMHRYCGAQPSAEKAPRGKKTQEHINAEYRRDWLNSAYWNETFHIPPEVVEAALSEAAREFRAGKTFKKALAVEDYFIPLQIYKNASDKAGFLAEGKLEDWYKPEYSDVRGVRIGPARIDRCRPIFREWGISFTVRFDPNSISEEQVKKAVASMAVGDFRPRYGRSQVVSAELVKVAA